MHLQPSQLADQLEITGRHLGQQLAGVDDAQARWKPSAEKWSILEVLVHMVEEEQFDFWPRILSTLEDPARPWPAIDPEGWVIERRYNERDPEETLDAFKQARVASLASLRNLDSSFELPPWENTYHHAKLGEIRAGDLMVSWLVHDELHLRQIANLKVLWLDEQAAPYSTHYAMP